MSGTLEPLAIVDGARFELVPAMVGTNARAARVEKGK